MSDDKNILEFRNPEPIATLKSPPVNITFTQPDGTVCGVFQFDDKTRTWSFEGDMEESAAKFIDFLTNVITPKGA